MKKTLALFALALSCLLAALIFGLPHRQKVVEHPLPILTPEPNPSSADPWRIKLGDRVTLDATLANPSLLANQAGTVSLLMDLNATAPQTGETPRRAIALVLDRSGSMAGDKIKQARASAKALVARLSDEDEITLITYASDFSVDLSLTKVGGNRPVIERVIDGILDGGGTNLAGGLEAGLRPLRTQSNLGVKRLILVSDGNANQGLTDPALIAEIARKARLDGISVSTLGLGYDFNEDLMTEIAQGGGGGYYYAKHASDIAPAIDQDLTGLTSLAARAVEVGLELAPGVSIEQVYGYRTEMRGGRIVIPVGDMASERRRVMVTLRVPAHSEGPAALTKLVLSYADENGGAASEFQGALGATAIASADAVTASQQIEVMAAFERAATAAAQEDAARTFQSGDRRKAVDRLKNQIAESKARNAWIKSEQVDTQVRELEGLVDSYEDTAPESDNGKDLVKSSKYRARQVFVY